MNRTFLKLAGVFTVGAVLGAAGVCVLAARASSLYVQMVRLSFASEEERRLVEAWSRGDLASAERHAACGIEAEGALVSFDPSRSMWDFSFPLFGLWVNEGTTYPVSDRTRLLALAHSRMAVVLERRGRAEDAALAYAEAARLGGGGSIDEWRSAAAIVLAGAGSPSASKAPEERK